MLELYKVGHLRKMAKGMPYRWTAKKYEIIAWLRENKPELEGKACDNFVDGPLYGDVCGNCGLHMTQHA
jgi:hypothetical protein